MTNAVVTGPSGEGFVARVTELRPNSILLRIDRQLQFRDRVKIDLLGTQIEGEVVFAGERQAAVTFAMSPEIFDLIERVESDPAEPATGDIVAPVLPHLDAKGVLEPASQVETLAHLLSLWANRPIVAKALLTLDRAELKHGDFAIALEAEALGEGLYALSAPDRRQLKESLARLRSVLDRFVLEGPPKAEAAPDDVPPLGDDSRVSFRDAAQYATQHRINIEKGALVVKSGPLPPGTKRELQILVPGSAPISIAAQVMFQGPGTVGFSITMNDALKAALRAPIDEPPKTPQPALAFMDTTGSHPVPRSLSGPRLSPALGHEAELAGPISVEELALLFSSRPSEIAGAEGSYLRALDFLLATEADARLRIAGEEEVCLWLYRGKVVFAARKPEKQDDLLGRRLVASRAVTRAAIDSVMPEVGPTKPLGALLVEKGKLTQELLNPELKAQIVDRAAVPCTFAQGKLQVLPWAEPPVRTKLMPVAGRYLMLEMIRNELRRWTPEEITRGMAKQFDSELHVDFGAIDAALRFGSKEQRFYQRISQTPSPLGTAGTTGGAGPSEGLKLALIGLALGFAKLEKLERARTSEVPRAFSTADILTQQLERAEHADAFEVLSLRWSATLREIRAAYDAERKKLMMRKRADDSTRELVVKLERRLDAALKSLTSGAERRSLRERAADAKERQDSAEQLVHQAEMAMFREDFEAASDLLDTADELAPITRTKQLRARLGTSM